MASRRSRIKGIANIPQRRKVNTLEEDPTDEVLTSGQNKVSDVSLDEDAPEKCVTREEAINTQEDAGVTQPHKNKPLALECDKNLNNAQKVENNVEVKAEDSLVENKELAKNTVVQADNALVKHEKLASKQGHRLNRFSKPKPSIVTFRRNKISDDTRKSDKISSETSDINKNQHGDTSEQLTDDAPEKCVTREEAINTQEDAAVTQPHKNKPLECDKNLNNAQKVENNVEVKPEDSLVENKELAKNTVVQADNALVKHEKLASKQGHRLNRFSKPKPSIVSLRRNKISDDTRKSDKISSEISEINKNQHGDTSEQLTDDAPEKCVTREEAINTQEDAAVTQPHKNKPLECDKNLNNAQKVENNVEVKPEDSLVENKELAKNTVVQADNALVKHEKLASKQGHRLNRFSKPKPYIVSLRRNKISDDTRKSDKISSEISEINKNQHGDTSEQLTDDEAIIAKERTVVLPLEGTEHALFGSQSTELSVNTSHTDTATESCSESLLPTNIHETKDKDINNREKVTVKDENVPPKCEENLDTYQKTDNSGIKTDKSLGVREKPALKQGHRLHRFIKPKPSIVTSRQNKVCSDSNKSSTISNETSEANKSDLKSVDESVAIEEKTFIAPLKEIEYTLCETQLTPHHVSTDLVNEKELKLVLPSTVATTNSEVEYPIPPASPNKINRSRIKAIPKFDNRRTSFSASESEDESRRQRHRNDSVSSSVSGLQETLSECMSPQRTKEFSSAFQKKCRRTEQSRKLAEARREFQIKFGKETPNRSKLTMMDLIFYNPKTNPMPGNKKIKTTSLSESENPDETPSEKPSENPGENPGENPDDPAEIVDDPKPNDKEHESEDENDIPAPQIKIGPTGELIIDEKSLVFESKKTKKDRAELQQSAVINVDHDGSYGTYKRGKRTKDWNQMDTIRFYKALNTIGTDFSLMCEFFPNRTRRELKVKFNKEERINRGLIDRAITQPTQFDFTLLQQEVLFEEEEKKCRDDNIRLAEEARKKSREENKEQSQLKKPRRINREERLKHLTDPEEAKSAKMKETQKKTRRKRKKKMKDYLRIDAVLQDDSEGESESGNSSDISDSKSEKYFEGSGDEIVVDERPTRYGRIPRKRKRYEPTFTSSYIKPTKAKKKNKDVVEKKYEPGSIMLVTTTGPNGEPVFNVLMVTADQNAEPIEVNSNVMETLKQAVTQVDHGTSEHGLLDELRNVKAQNILKITARPLKEETKEENISIPSAENRDPEASVAPDRNHAVENIPDENAEFLPQTEALNLTIHLKNNCDKSDVASDELSSVTVVENNFTICHDSVTSMDTTPIENITVSCTNKTVSDRLIIQDKTMENNVTICHEINSPMDTSPLKDDITLPHIADELSGKLVENSAKGNVDDELSIFYRNEELSNVPGSDIIEPEPDNTS